VTLRRRPGRPGRDGGEGEPSEAAPERPSAGDKAAQLLALRPHFRRELELKLARAGYDREEIREALDRLARLGLLDDAALAKGFVATVANRKGFGRRRIAQELSRRGAPEAAARAALESRSGDDDLERAREAATRFVAKGGRDPQRLARQLDRKGFAKDAIFKVLKEMALAAPAEDTETPAED
jgi:regulatory protein